MLLAAALICSTIGNVRAADETSLHAFATSTIGTGDMHSWGEVVGTNLAGLDAADGICQVRAAESGLPHPEDFVAWLSDRNDDAYCRVFGLSGKLANHCGLLVRPVGAGPWLRTDGVPFAGTIEDALADNVVYSTLSVDESGDPLLMPFESFTGTDVDGTFITKFDNSADCEGWTTTQPSIARSAPRPRWVPIFPRVVIGRSTGMARRARPNTI